MTRSYLWLDGMLVVLLMSPDKDSVSITPLEEADMSYGTLYDVEVVRVSTHVRKEYTYNDKTFLPYRMAKEGGIDSSFEEICTFSKSCKFAKSCMST